MQSKEGTLQYMVYVFWDYFDERIFIADEPQNQSPKSTFLYATFFTLQRSLAPDLFFQTLDYM